MVNARRLRSNCHCSCNSTLPMTIYFTIYNIHNIIYTVILSQYIIYNTHLHHAAKQVARKLHILKLFGPKQLTNLKFIIRKNGLIFLAVFILVLSQGKSRKYLQCQFCQFTSMLINCSAKLKGPLKQSNASYISTTNNANSAKSMYLSCQFCQFTSILIDCSANLKRSAQTVAKTGLFQRWKTCLVTGSGKYK